MEINYSEVISFARLKEVIQEKGLTVKHVAELCGKKPNDISMVINGVTFPKTDFIAKLCSVLKVSVDEICVFKGIGKGIFDKEFLESNPSLYKPGEEVAGEVTYKPLRRYFEIYLEEKNKDREELMTADDIYDQIPSPRRSSGAYDKSGKGLKAAMKARGIDENYVPKIQRNRRDYSKGLTYPTRVKLRQDKPLNIRTIYNICKVLGCTPGQIMSYK